LVPEVDGPCAVKVSKILTRVAGSGLVRQGGRKSARLGATQRMFSNVEEKTKGTE